MLRKLGIIFILSIIVQLNSFGQAEQTIKPLSPAEHALLDFITSDSVEDLSLDLFKENLRFGVSTKFANGVSLLKRKGQIYLVLMGSGRLYQIQKKAKGTYELIRIDSTFHTGSNFGSINFFYKDTLFKLGGIGFWKIKDYFTFFSNKTHEWELLGTKKGVFVYQSPDKGILYYLDQLNGKLYLFGSPLLAKFSI